MSDAFWMAFFGFLATFLLGLLNAWRQRKIETKVDDNTQLTKDGTAKAVANAKDAAYAAGTAKAATELLYERMNGGLDDRITKIVKEHTEPLVKAFSEHNDQDQRNMNKIELAIKQLADQSKAIPGAVARESAVVAAEMVRQHDKASDSSDAFVKGVEHGIAMGEQKARLAMEREQQQKKEGGK